MLSGRAAALKLEPMPSPRELRFGVFLMLLLQWPLLCRTGASRPPHNISSRDRHARWAEASDTVEKLRKRVQVRDQRVDLVAVLR